MELEEFVNKVLPMKNQLFRIAKRILNSYEDAEEVVQETFIRMWEKRNTIKINMNINSYAISVTRNLSIDMLRSKYYKNKGVSFSDIEYEITEQNPSEKATELKNINEIINKIIGSLPERSRTIIQLRDIEGYSNQEVAKMLNLDVNVIKIDLSRTRKKIREILYNKYNFTYNE